MNKYLFTYKLESERGSNEYDENDIVSEIATISRIADVIGMSDCNDTYGHRVYKITDNGVKQLRICHYFDIDGRWMPLTIKLYDGNVCVNSAEYDDH